MQPGRHIVNVRQSISAVTRISLCLPMFARAQCCAVLERAKMHSFKCELFRLRVDNHWKVEEFRKVIYSSEVGAILP